MSDYALEGPKWGSSTITWSFANAGGDVSGSIDADHRATIEAAVARWGQVSNLTFKEVSDTTLASISASAGACSAVARSARPTIPTR